MAFLGALSRYFLSFTSPLSIQNSQKGLKISFEFAVIRVVITFPPHWNVVLTTKDYRFYNRLHFVSIFNDAVTRHSDREVHDKCTELQQPMKKDFDWCTIMLSQ